MEYILSALLIGVIYLAIAWWVDRVASFWGVGLLAVALFLAAPLVISPFAGLVGVFTFLFCLLSLPALPFFETRPPVGFWAAAAGVVVAGGLSFFIIYSALQKFDRMAEKYPLESLESRLAYEHQAASKPGTSIELPPLLEKRMQQRETLQQGTTMRTVDLAILHSDARMEFAAREGFGIGRMRRLIERRMDLPETPPVPQPTPSEDSATPESAPLAAGELPPDPPSSSQLLALHSGGESDFLSINRMGYVRSRKEVAGFLAHQLEALPDRGSETVDPVRIPRGWQIARLELIGILRHEQPVVYVGENLPNLKDLDKYKTRPLNPFEASALEKLRRQEDLVVEESANRVQMVGSLRATNQCTACHEVQRGELLGAFSYILRRPQAIPPKPALQPST